MLFGRLPANPFTARFEGAAMPQIHPTAYVAPNAVIDGDVTRTRNRRGA
ncbi:hypothetical protein [Paraburkholderia humisilvae]|uniref:Gamma carbonic anhydrase family protein n=1 Tax=Paraburkholderia humisilvae TaxID=627669 RepID=A0A6J5ER00_9BURK|nr:hypothetical protein [Paraburkholderia humisilvae]CAB3768324.1 hypothetical protein LMG29542_05839 [Paraburkholderia humisilvae]